ncbi:GntR family transcriptional regulator [Kribbella sp. NPDC056861]|uniref:GntR family transcriptional regulator n=1 Tax=Kribbella sp. NPDC056861 TaxID=3154857 RepID=UPI00341E8010
MEQIGVSRNTVRAAVSRLEHEGLVEDLGGSRRRVVSQRMRFDFDMSKFELGAYTNDPPPAKTNGLPGRGSELDRPPGRRQRERAAHAILGRGVPRAGEGRHASRPEEGIPERVAMIGHVDATRHRLQAHRRQGAPDEPRRHQCSPAASITPSASARSASSTTSKSAYPPPKRRS